MCTRQPEGMRAGPSQRSQAISQGQDVAGVKQGAHWGCCGAEKIPRAVRGRGWGNPEPHRAGQTEPSPDARAPGPLSHSPPFQHLEDTLERAELAEKLLEGSVLSSQTNLSRWTGLCVIHCCVTNKPKYLDEHSSHFLFFLILRVAGWVPS